MGVEVDARTILSALPDLVFHFDRDGTFLGFHAGDSTQLFVEPERIVGATLAELFPPEVVPPALRAIEAALESGDVQVFGYRLRFPDEPRWYEARIAPVGGDEVVAIVRDVTPLRRSEMRFEALVQSLDAVVWEGSTAPRAFTFVSDGARELFGYPLARWHEPGFWESRVHEEDREAAREAYARAGEEAANHEIEYRMRAADGRLVWVHDTVNVTTAGVARGVMVDVTARKQLEAERRRVQQQLMRSQKLESMGLLAGGIAHDFNNLLTGILGNASILAHELDASSPLRDRVDDLVTAAEHAAALTRQILAYSGKGTFELRRVDVSRSIEELAPLLKTSISRAVELELCLGTDLPPVEADPSQLHQVVMNLALNGADALEGRPGTVALTTDTVRLEARDLAELDVGAGRSPGRYVRIAVRDTGAGISPAARSRILDPFFTTKRQGRGLGLATVVGTVRSHGGGLRIRSAPSEGSTFEVFLPVAAGAAEDEPATTPRPRPGRGAGLVLVIDDEPTVRAFAASALKRAGFEVRSAEHGQRGLDVFREAHEQLALVVLDVTMPVMGGADCLEAMRALDPACPILLVSGYDEVEPTRRFADADPVAFLQKPFSADALVARCLELARQPSRRKVAR